jgi:hypothetical protein
MSSSQTKSSRGIFFWALSPFLLVFIVVMALLIDKRGASSLVTLVAIELLAVLMLLGLFDPVRFWWAWRGVGAIVFLGFVAYLIAMIIEGKFFAARRAESAAITAFVGLVVFGIPGLWFALTGRLTPRLQTYFKNDDELNDGGG